MIKVQDEQGKNVLEPRIIVTASNAFIAKNGMSGQDEFDF